MTSLLNGFIGGLVVGALAASATRLVATYPSSTTVLLRRYLGRGVEVSDTLVFAVQIAYGCFAGGVLVGLDLFILNLLAVPPAIGKAVGIAVIWSGFLAAIWVIYSWIATRRTAGGTPRRELLAYHLVYGLGLGLWIRFTWIM